MADWLEPTSFGVPAVDNPNCRREHRRERRPTIYEQRGAVAEENVRCPAFPHTVGGELASNLAALPPDGLACPGVVVIGPEQELQALAAELEVRCELVDGMLATFRSPECRRIDTKLNDNRLTMHPIAMQVHYHRTWTSEISDPDYDTLARRPGLWWGVAGQNDYASTELGWPSGGHEPW
jgi:hypothetical protein